MAFINKGNDEKYLRFPFRGISKVILAAYQFIEFFSKYVQFMHPIQHIYCLSNDPTCICKIANVHF